MSSPTVHPTSAGKSYTTVSCVDDRHGACDGIVHVARVGQLMADADRQACACACHAPAETAQRWQLVDEATGAVIEPGAEVTTFRGEPATLLRAHRPASGVSNGKIEVELHSARREFYPSVIRARYVPAPAEAVAS